MKKLTDNDLLNLLGGDSISREEFCAQLKKILQDQDTDEGPFEGAVIAYAKECVGY
ncbi:MAG: hypothetical protein K2G13_06195 [Muribaculaceae bacterium]|nr:hypothetical protein [Muribaculaceae bacterium]